MTDQCLAHAWPVSDKWMASDWAVTHRCLIKDGPVSAQCLTTDWPMIDPWLTNAFRQPRRGPSLARSTGGGKLCSEHEARGSTYPHNATAVARTQHDQWLRAHAPFLPHPCPSGDLSAWSQLAHGSKTSMRIARTCVLPAFVANLCTHVLHDAPPRLPRSQCGPG